MQRLSSVNPEVAESRGKVSDQQLTAVREAGYGDAEIVEIVDTATNFGSLTKTG